MKIISVDRALGSTISSQAKLVLQRIDETGYENSNELELVAQSFKACLKFTSDDGYGYGNTFEKYKDGLRSLHALEIHKSEVFVMKLVDGLIVETEENFQDYGVQAVVNCLAHHVSIIRSWTVKRLLHHINQLLNKDEVTLPASSVYKIFQQLRIYLEKPVIQQLFEYSINDTTEGETNVAKDSADIACRIMSVLFLFPSYYKDVTRMLKPFFTYGLQCVQKFWSGSENWSFLRFLE